MRTRVFFRADGNSLIGLGHLYRCLALSDMLSDEFECSFIVQQESFEALKLIANQRFEIVELPADLDIMYESEFLSSLVTGFDIIVLDGYHFTFEYQKKIGSLVGKVVVIDDLCNDYIAADLIINHGGASLARSYKELSNAVLLLGFPYAILRKEFLGDNRIKKKLENSERLFVCFGGADPFENSIKFTLAALRCKAVKDVTLVVGTSFKKTELLDELQTTVGRNVEIRRNISAADMVTAIRRSKWALCPASSIAMEVCSLGVPLLTGVVADNQQNIHDQLIKEGCAVSGGNLTSLNDREIQNLIEFFLQGPLDEMIARQMTAIDGLSGKRILTEFMKLSAA